jgi:hypothetical protein
MWMVGTIAAGGCRTPNTSLPRSSQGPTARVNEPAAIAASSTPTGRPQIAIDVEATAGSITVATQDPRVAMAASTIANLSEADTRALHARMEPLPDVTGDNAKAPTMRAPSMMPPREGPVQPIAFVVPTGKAVTDAPIAPGKYTAPLAAPQITPQGEVRAESEIRVRFSEPMVPVAAVGTPALPKITIEPAVTGEWRWIDTRVVQFTAAPRLPQATEYTVTVQPGVEAISGAKLMAAATQKFSTPPIALRGGFPNSVIRSDSPIVVMLDQDADVAKLAPLLKVTREKNQARVPHVVTSLDAARPRWSRNPSLDPTKWQLPSTKRYLVLAPQGAWPPGEQIQVVLDKGAPSAEGPRRSTQQSFVNFDVAPLFKAEGLTCGDLEKPQMFGASCPIKSWMSVQFSSSILESSYRAHKVQIAGLPFEDNKPSGNSVSLYAPDVVGRAFTIPIGEGLLDIFGQPLIGGRTLGFTTSPARFYPYLEAVSGMRVLDPRWQIPQWIVTSEAVTSVRVQLYQVTPKDYFAYAAFEAGDRPVPPGKQVFDKTYAVGRQHGADLRVDLRPALDSSGLGHVIAIATNNAPPRPDQERQRQVAWLQVTRLGMSARVDGQHVNAWVQDITPKTRFLAPIEGATASLVLEATGEVATAKSDAKGHVKLDLLPPVALKPDARKPGVLLQVTSGADTAFSAMHSYERTQRVDNALWYVTDDRFTYKPGETVYVKGWVRWTHNGVNPGLSLPRPGDSLSYTLADVRGGKIASGTAQLTDQGGFHVEVALPKNANLGTASFTFTTRGHSHRHPISVQEFRTPAYSVSLDDDVSHSGALPVILGESIEMQSTAKYYAGGGLAGAAIQWDATLSTTTYTPPGWARFEFSPPRARSRHRSYRERHSTTARQAGSLSSASSANVVWGIAALPHNTPSVLSVDATVTDVDRTSIRASSRPILVHPAAYYVGLRLKPETTDTIEAIVTDIDGHAVPDVAIAIDIEGVLGSERYRDDAKVIDTQHCKLTSAAAPVPCRFTRKDIQTAYTARAQIADARGRVSSAHFDVPWWSRDDKRDLVLVPDKQRYRPGDVAKIEIRSTITPATAVVSFARQGVFAQQRVELTGASTTVELPIEVTHIQNLHVVVDRYAKRRSQWAPPKKPALDPLPEATSAEIALEVDLESARLDMVTRPTQKLVQPGEEATFEIDVRHRDKPVAGAEVALMVVDEAVLALSARSHADPLAPFYRHVHGGTWQLSNLGMVLDSGATLDGAPGFETYKLSDVGRHAYGSGYGSGYGTIGRGMGGGGAGMGSAIVTARKDFRATAVFSPTLETDANGRASVTVKMPDSLTRFRIVALATHGGHLFGKAENTIIAQRKVNARTVAPRFLAQGDTFALPIVVQNLDTKPRSVDIAVRAANLVARGPAGKRVTIPAGQRAEVRFDFSTKARGKAVIQTILVSGAFADASNVEVPIYEPATTESFATYGVVDDKPQREQLVVPQSVFADVGGVEVEVSSTQLSSLTDAYWYLYAYPYECAEQRSGRMLATAAMFDILDAFATPGRPTKGEIDAQRNKDAVALAKTQQADGGWGYFGGMKSDAMVTMQVLQALAAQKVANQTTQRAIAYVTKQSAALFAQLEKAAALPPPRRKDRLEHPFAVSLAALSLTVLGQAGQDVRPRAERLHALATTLDAYPVDAKARVLSIMAKLDRARAARAKLLADLLSVTHETASTAQVTTQYVEAERLLLVSTTKTNALVLDALIREASDHAIITKLARGVLDGRKHGRWMSTQENLVALQAMRKFFDVYEKATPDYTGKLWLGTASYAEQPFVGRSSARGVARADWTQLAPGSTHDIALQRDGRAGRMYYRVGITYAPKQVDLPALDAGFIVRRTYTAADDPGDVVKQPDGSYRIKLGAKVVVTLEALNTTTRHAVALVDPLPAGFEAINSALAIAERPAHTGPTDRWDHVNMRDNRAEAFRMHLAAGAHRFSYSVRATTPGRFVAAPTKAEEMYAPETFGRSTGTAVVIE